MSIGVEKAKNRLDILERNLTRTVAHNAVFELVTVERHYKRPHMALRFGQVVTFEINIYTAGGADKAAAIHIPDFSGSLRLKLGLAD